jgi:ribose transport system permease protein
METIASGSTRRRTYLYENRWWKLAFNAVWVVLMAVVVVALLLLGSVLFSPTFFAAPNLTQLTWQWLVRAILIPPVVLIIASGGVDLSIGALIGLTTVLMASLSPLVGVFGAVVAALVVAVFVGLVNGVVVGATRIHGAIVTLAAATLARGLALGFSAGKVTALGQAGLLASPALPWAALALSLVLGIVWALLIGRRPAAGVGQEPSSSWFRRLLSTGFPYLFSAVMAGVAGVVIGGRLGVGTASAGSGFEVDALLIALLGGTALGSAASSRLPVSNSLVNMLGGLGAALALVLVQNMQALAGAQASGAQDLGKGVVLLVTGLVSYIYYVLVGRLRSPASPSAEEQKPK